MEMGNNIRTERIKPREELDKWLRASAAVIAECEILEPGKIGSTIAEPTVTYLTASGE